MKDRKPTKSDIDHQMKVAREIMTKRERAMMELAGQIMDEDREMFLAARWRKASASCIATRRNLPPSNR